MQIGRAAATKLKVVHPQPDTSDGLYVLHVNAHEAKKIHGSEGYWKSRWSPNGKHLVSVASNNKTIGVFRLGVSELDLDRTRHLF